MTRGNVGSVDGSAEGSSAPTAEELKELGRAKLAEMFEGVPRAGNRRYGVDDCLVCLTLLARGHSLIDVAMATGVNDQTIYIWKRRFVDGSLETKFPNLAEAAAVFDVSAVPEIGSVKNYHQSLRVRSALQRKNSGNPYVEGEVLPSAGLLSG